MADLTVIRNQLATQIMTVTGLRCDGQARDQVSPPCAIVLPGQPYVTYGSTMDGAFNFSLRVLIIISDAAPADVVQRAMDSWLGIGSEDLESIPAAVMSDTTLGGTVHFIEPISISTYGRLSYAGVDYWGSTVLLQGGAI